MTEAETNAAPMRLRAEAPRVTRLSRKMLASVAAAALVAPAPAASPAADDFAGAVKSPMVGTVYLAPEPGAPNFASPGSAVKEGDTILIIEAMKVMNPIVAPAAGTLKAVHVENSQPVEFDQPLFTIG